MRFLRGFNESDNISIYDERIREFFPDEVHLYTSEGSYTLVKSDITLENDVIRAFYYHNTVETGGGDVSRDGEPDSLAFDIHFVKNENGFKTLVDITYGDQMKSEFSIEAPNKISIIHYNGIGSLADTHTHFGFEEDTIKDIVRLFNSFNFGYKLNNDDFNFIDKYPDTHIHESIKLMPLPEDKKILVVNNGGNIENRYLKNIVNYLVSRGIDYVVASGLDEIPDLNNIVGAISTGSDFRITKSDSEAKLAFEVYKNIKSPVLGICYGFQAMVKFYGGSLKDSGDFTHEHIKLTNANLNHSLFKNIDLSNIEFSFSFHDIIDKDPEGFKQIAMIKDIIVGISDEKRKRYGLLFHPEDKEMSYPVLDNFIRMCLGGVDEQEKLKIGQFEHLVNFKNFTN
jgi:GMP synthase-like glutamine amidotransferase